MTVFYSCDWGRSGEGNNLPSYAIFRMDDLRAALPEGSDVNDETLMDATRNCDPIEVFYAASLEAAHQDARHAIAEKYNGREYDPNID